MFYFVSIGLIITYYNIYYFVILSSICSQWQLHLSDYLQSSIIDCQSLCSIFNPTYERLFVEVCLIWLIYNQAVMSLSTFAISQTMSQQHPDPQRKSDLGSIDQRWSNVSWTSGPLTSQPPAKIKSEAQNEQQRVPAGAGCWQDKPT